MKVERFPLAWPDGRTRTPAHQRTESRFMRSTGGAARYTSRFHSMAEAVSLIENEVRRIGGIGLVISTNVKLRIDGLPYSGQAQPADTGAAVYFSLKNRPTAFSCDRYRRVECNLYAIGMTIEATRAIQRWGAATVEQSFRGFAAIPERTGGITWWTVLQVDHNATEEQIKDRYRELAKTHHPDKGGDPEEWLKIRQALDQAQALLRR